MSSFKQEDTPTLLPISEPWLKYLSQCTQVFKLCKHLNTVLEKAEMLSCKLCKARESALLLSDFCWHFAPKQANTGNRVTFQVYLRAEPICPQDKAKVLHAELLQGVQPSLSVPFQVTTGCHVQCSFLPTYPLVCQST